MLASSNIQKILLNKSEKAAESNISVFLRQYLGGFLESFFQSKVFIRIIPYLDFPILVSTALKLFTFEYKTYQRSIGAGFFLDEMVSLLWYSLFIKDPKIFLV